MNLNSIKKADMEKILNEILEDLKDCDSALCDKYRVMVEDILYCIDATEADEIVHSFKPYGEAFSKERVKEILNKMHISVDACIDYYLCMNMFYNDYKSYAENKRLDVQDFCFEMSKLFINDSDAPKHKVSKFFKMFLEENKKE